MERAFTIGEGRFYCPECRATRKYEKKEKKAAYVIMAVPVSPRQVVGYYIECASCGNSFREHVLESSPETARAEFHPAMKRVMILMVLADGEINEKEIRSIRDIYEKVTGNPVDPDELIRDIEQATSDGHTVDEYLKKVTPYLNRYGKEQVLRSAFHVATSDGVFQDQEKRLLDEIARVLAMSDDHYQSLLEALADEEKMGVGASA